VSRSSIDIPVVSKFDPTGIKQAQTALGGFGKSLLSVGALVAGAFAIRGIFNFGMEAIIAAERAQKFNDVLAQVAKTTGVFGSDVNAATSRMIKFADAQELVIGVEAELIKETQGVLLSFKQVGASGDEVGGVFDRATKAAFDMAAVLGTDAKGSAIQLGKALENPIKGVNALARAGTTFTDQQKEQIRVLVESGDMLAAQTLILDEVESQYGGAAEAAAVGSEKMKLAFGQIQDALGAALAPAFEKFTTYFINEVVPPLTKFFEEDFPRIIEEFKPLAEDIAVFFGDVGDKLKEFLNIDADTSLLEGILDKFNEIGANEEFQTFLTNVKDIFDELGPLVADLVFSLGELAVKLAPLLKDTLNEVIPILDNLLSIFTDIDFFLGEIISGFGSFEGEMPSFLKFIENSINPMARLKTAVQGVADALNALFDAYVRAQNRGVPLPSELASGGRRFATRGDGGRVTGGGSYLVGEMGPELFMPGRGGNIVPNDRLGGGGGPTYNITINANVADARLGEVVVNAIKRYERNSGPVFAKA
jgi:hypothetical protein